VVFVVREVDAAIIPRIAVTASGFETGKGRLGSVARSMLEQGPRRVSVFTSVEDGREGGHAAWLAEPVEHTARLIITTKMRACRGIGAIDSRFRALEELRLEEGQRVFERVGLGPWKGATDGVGV
jgi:hypothetical protein